MSRHIKFPAGWYGRFPRPSQALVEGYSTIEAINNLRKIMIDVVEQSNQTADIADTALTNSEIAVQTANDANNKSDNALVIANRAEMKADAAVSTAGAANAKSDTAVTTANNALSVANGIDGKATQAINTANNALTVANGIDAKATEALSNSVTANTNATNAVNTANGIDAKASTALTNSTNAVNTANATTTGLAQVRPNSYTSVQLTGEVLADGFSTIFDLTKNYIALTITSLNPQDPTTNFIDIFVGKTGLLGLNKTNSVFRLYYPTPKQTGTKTYTMNVTLEKLVFPVNYVNNMTVRLTGNIFCVLLPDAPGGVADAYSSFSTLMSINPEDLSTNTFTIKSNATATYGSIYRITANS